MCDFKPGDEVVCITDEWFVRAPKWKFWRKNEAGRGPKSGDVCVLTRVFWGTNMVTGAHEVGVCLAGWNDTYTGSSFRKIQKRDLKIWLSTENTIEGPVRPRKRERAS